MTAPLNPALPFIEGETLSGYVSRQAKLHETTPRDFCSDLGMRWPYLCGGHADQIERLAWLTGERLDKLRAISVGKARIGRFKFGQTVATFGAIRRTAVRFCPKCVTNALVETGPHGVFQMQEWLLASLHTCPLHSCPLTTLPSSPHSHTTYDFASRILDHLDEVQASSKNTEMLLPSAFEHYIRSRIWRGPQNDWLRYLDLNQIHRLCLNLGASLKGLKMKAMMTLAGDQESSLCQMGFEYVSAGPEGFNSALKRLHQQSRAKRPYYSSDLGPFYRWLKRSYDDPALAPVVDLTCAHIFETYPTPAGKEIFNRVAPTQTVLTMHEARKRSGFGVTFLKKLLGHMDGIDEAEALLRTDVHVDELARVMEFWGNLIKLNDAV